MGTHVGGGGECGSGILVCIFSAKQKAKLTGESEDGGGGVRGLEKEKRFAFFLHRAAGKHNVSQNRAPHSLGFWGRQFPYL